jgi:hypothetical protein
VEEDPGLSACKPSTWSQSVCLPRRRRRRKRRGETETEKQRDRDRETERQTERYRQREYQRAFYISDNYILESHSIKLGWHVTTFPLFIRRLKKKKQAKQNAEIVSAASSKSRSGKDDANSDILEQDKFNVTAEGDHSTDDKKKRKSNQLKEIRRTELKRYYSVGKYL